MLASDPKNRYTLQQILDHTWLAKFRTSNSLRASTASTTLTTLSMPTLTTVAKQGLFNARRALRVLLSIVRMSVYMKKAIKRQTTAFSLDSSLYNGDSVNC